MISKSQLKTIRTLQTKKHRQKYQKFAVEGEKIVREALLECPENIELILVSNTQFQKHNLPVPATVPWYETDEGTMKEVSSLQTPPGIMAILNMKEESKPEAIITDWMIYLDGVRDPGNLGTIIRTADWFGFSTLLLGPGCVDWSNPKVLQASMGSIFRVHCLYIEIQQVKQFWPDHHLYAGDLTGQNPSLVEWPERGILIMGGESHGLASVDSGLQVNRICIKKDPGSRAESLNVATAAGILMSMIAR